MTPKNDDDLDLTSLMKEFIASRNRETELREEMRRLRREVSDHKDLVRESYSTAKRTTEENKKLARLVDNYESRESDFRRQTQQYEATIRGLEERIGKDKKMQEYREPVHDETPPTEEKAEGLLGIQVSYRGSFGDLREELDNRQIEVSGNKGDFYFTTEHKMSRMSPDSFPIGEARHTVGPTHGYCEQNLPQGNYTITAYLEGHTMTRKISLGEEHFVKFVFPLDRPDER